MSFATGITIMCFLLPVAVYPSQPLRASVDPDSWTFMVYLDADNDLEGVGIDDFLEMASVDSSPRLNIVVQLDRFYAPWWLEFDDDRYGNWTTCKRFLVSQGMTPTPANALMDIGEVDMGDPATLVDFVTWSLETYPADRYALVIWDHGGSWYGCCWDYTNGFSYIDENELVTAMWDIYNANDLIVYDILAFDACSMSSLEVAYDMEGYADFMMASEIYVPNEGLNYSSLQAIVDGPYITPSQLCSRFLVDYAAYYYSLEGTPLEYEINESFTMSVIDLNSIYPVVQGIDLLASELIERLCIWRDDISSARNLMEDYHGAWWEDAVDIRHMCEMLRSELPSDPELEAVASQLISAFDACIVDHLWGTNPENCTFPVFNTHGLSVNYPAYDAYFDTDYLSEGLCWLTHDTQWDEFLEYAVLGHPCVCAHLPVGDSVLCDEIVEAWISEPIDTAGSYSVVVYPTSLGYDYRIDGSLSWDGSECKLAFVPADLLLPFTNYTVAVEAYDMQGLPVQTSWTFVTGEEIPEFPSGVIPALLLFAIVLALSRNRIRRR